MPNIDKIRVDNVDYNVVGSAESLPVGSEIDYDGSTVPDGWQEVTDAFSWSSATINSSYMHSETKVKYFKFKNMVIVNFIDIHFSNTSASTTGTQIASGLPPATEQLVFVLPDFNSTKSLRLRMTTTGTIETHYTDTSAFGTSYQYYGNIVYLTSE